MAQYHTVPTAERAHDAPSKPSIGTLRPWEPVEWWPNRNVMVAQDTLVPCARRPLYSFGLEGYNEWPFADNADSTASPDVDAWRVVLPSLDVTLTPGSFLRLHVLYAPSGMASTANHDTDAYASGAIRLTVSWSSQDGATTSGPDTYDLTLPATFPDGDLPTAAGALWSHVYEAEIAEIWPSNASVSKSTGSAYSEGCVASVAISIQGGARIIDCTLYEYPLAHIQANDETDPVSVHGAYENGQPPATPRTPRPQVARRDSPLWDERRYGTNQTLRTAHQQTEALGPRVMCWSPWTSDNTNWDDENSLTESDVEPVIVSGTTQTEIVSGATGGYDATAPGWLVHCSHAQLARYSDSNLIIGEGRAVVPVRVQVRARWTGTTQGLVRLQSSATEWIDVVFDSSTTKETREAIGWLETQPAADQAVAVLQAFVVNSDAGDDLEVYGIAVDWGWNT